jgi:hypothetical protein
MKKTTIHKKDILFFTFSFFLITVAWVGFNLYHTSITSTISENIQKQLTPIANQFDTATIEQLKHRTPISPLFIKTEQASLSATLTPTETQQENALIPSP